MNLSYFMFTIFSSVSEIKNSSLSHKDHICKENIALLFSQPYCNDKNYSSDIAFCHLLLHLCESKCCSLISEIKISLS